MHNDLIKKLKCAKLFSGDCSFVGKSKSKQELVDIMHMHIESEHSDHQLERSDLEKKVSTLFD